MTYLTVPDKAAGDVFTEAMWDSYIKDNLNKGVNRPIGEAILGADAATIDFNPVDQSFGALLAIVFARTDRAATSDTLIVRMNNDSGANYDWQQITGNSTTVATNENFGATSISCGETAGNTAPANVFSANAVIIPHYAAALNNKSLLAFAFNKRVVAAGGLVVASLGGAWRSNAAISRLTFLPSVGANFKSGTRITLYGLAGL